METIVVGDIHLRPFWKKLKDDKTNRTIVCLGDYLDPYHIVSPQDAIRELKELFEWAEDNSQRVKLLIGNHDLFYLKGEEYACCRHYWDDLDEISQIYKEYSYLLNYAYKENNALFTHAGVSSDWINKYDLYFLNQDNVIDYLNSDPDTIWKIGRSRGGRDYASSPLWQCWYGDWPWDENPFELTQIFGHSQLPFNEPRHNTTQRIINCDCREVLIWDGKQIKLYE